MFSILSSTIRRSITNILRRKLHTNIRLLEKKKDDIQVEHNPCNLEPLEYESPTLRTHDNCQRQELFDFGMYVATCLPKFVQKVQIQHCDELEILAAPEGMYQVLSFMAYHQHACFNVCSCMTAIDVPSREYRFEVVYNLLSLRFGARARVKTYTDELTPLRSASDIWRNCNPGERECYDLFGVVFTHHPDLRRVLTDYGFSGHPLRKDFPLVGYTEVRYDDELKKIVYEPVEFQQEVRSYKLESPWTYMGNFHEEFNKPMPKKQK